MLKCFLLALCLTWAKEAGKKIRNPEQITDFSAPNLSLLISHFGGNRFEACSMQARLSSQEPFSLFLTITALVFQGVLCRSLRRCHCPSGSCLPTRQLLCSPAWLASSLPVESDLALHPEMTLRLKGESLQFSYADHVHGALYLREWWRQHRSLLAPGRSRCPHSM